LSNALGRRPHARFLCRFHALGLALLAAVLPPAAHAAGPDAPWEGEPFTGDPAAIVRAAEAAAPAGKHDVAVLFVESSFSYDEAGREVSRHRLVYRVRAREVHESWSEAALSWAPWHQERPSLRARVIGPDGVVHPLDPATLHESAVSPVAPELYDDRRRLVAPLPAVGPGAIVEQELTLVEREPMLGVGTYREQVIAHGVPVRHARLVVEVPAGASLQWTTRALPADPPRETVSAGRRRLEFDYRDLTPVEDAEAGTPPEAASYRSVLFSSGRSWAEVAARYAQVVEEALAGADLAALASQAGTGGSRAEIVERLLALVHREVRYTGLELGAASVVPRAPAETLQRKYGDCKDQAVLLAALLRAAGVPAHVVLLKAGFDADVDPSLPGFGGFNHAIVQIPGEPVLWIDPTDPYARAGELPEADQGRLALVVEPATAGLVRIPETVAADNRQVDTVEFELAELGKARLTVRQELTGGLERQMRSFLSFLEGSERREEMQELLAIRYMGEKLESLEAPEPGNLSRPLQLRMSIQEVALGETDLLSAAVAVPLGVLLDDLPGVLSEAGDAEAPPRRSDFRFEVPFVHEARYRVVAPLGFAARPLPAARQRTLGTATLSEEYALAADGAITATFRFDSGKRRLSPSEFEALRKAVLAFQEEEPVMLWFDQVGEAHLAAGRVLEAVGEFRRLAADAPAKALPRSRLARALLAGGMGLAARKEAEAAVALEPGSAAAHAALGWVLQHDLVGRRLGKGSDRERALAAYRKARELDPANGVVRADLAILLEHDAEGGRYTDPEDLAAAIDEYRALRAELEETGMDDNLVIALLQAGRLAELKQLLAELDETPLRVQLRLVAIAGLEGAEAAAREADRALAEPTQRLAALIGAADNLTLGRRYAEAAGLLAHAAKSSPEAAALLARADILRRTRRHDEVPVPADQPAGVARRYFAIVLDPGAPPAEVRALFSEELNRRGIVERDIVANLAGARRQLLTAGLPPDVLQDILLAAMQEVVAGDEATGWRVQLESQAPGRSDELLVFVIREEGRLRVAATSDMLGGLGLEALRRVTAADLPGARRWLDWARAEIPATRSDDPLAGVPFSDLWIRGAPASLEETRCAAAALAADFVGSELVPVLAGCRAAAGEPARQAAFDRAEAAAHARVKRFAEQLAAARRLREAYPDSESAFRAEAAALGPLERWDALREIAEERLGRIPGDTAAEQALCGIAQSTGALAEQRQCLERLIASGRAGAMEHNNLAWLALVVERVTEDDIEHAQRAASLDEFGNRASLHTLAALYAEVGKAAEAYQVLLQALAAGDGEPNSHDWYVMGRLAEHYGLPDVARDYYARVENEEGRADPSSTYALAQRRLQRLAPRT
jgi:transglutaminase-like putative cysteine protease